MIREIYLDNSATTKPYDEVIEYIDYVNKNIYGNPSSLHTKGLEAERLVKKGREQIAAALKVESKKIYFTSGGTESNNLAIRGYLQANPRKGRHIITTKIEHSSVLEVYKYLSQNGFHVDYLNIDSNGMIDMDELKSKISKDTSLISIILVNNEIGSIQNIEEIIKVKNSINSSTALHIDAIQAFGKLELLPARNGIDLLSLSSHKIHGPKGVGAVYVSKDIRIKPIIFGGGQESLMRSGTENVSGICGFGLAAEITINKMSESIKQVSNLKKLLSEKLMEKIENTLIISPQNSLPYILCIAFKDIRAEVLLHHLEGKGIYVSTGSACSSRKNIRSHVLQAIGIDPKYIDGAIRFSFSRFNSEDDIKETVKAIEEIVPVIRIKKGT